MRLIEKWAPLLVCIREGQAETDEIAQLTAAFEPHFRKGVPYAVLNLSSLDARVPSARDRMQLAAWANQEGVRRASRALCVGSATVVARDWERQALVAIQWLWTPVSPHHVVPSVSEGLEYCLSELVARGVPLPVSKDTLLRAVGQALRLERVAGLAPPEVAKATLTSAKLARVRLDILSDAAGTISLGWVASGVLWARLRGRLSEGLASAYVSHLSALLDGVDGVQFFIDSGGLQAYELSARNVATSFLVSQRRRFSRVALLNWAGGPSPAGNAAIDDFGRTLQIVATQQEFEQLLHAVAPAASREIRALDGSTPGSTASRLADD